MAKQNPIESILGVQAGVHARAVTDDAADFVSVRVVAVDVEGLVTSALRSLLRTQIELYVEGFVATYGSRSRRFARVFVFVDGMGLEEYVVRDRGWAAAPGDDSGLVQVRRLALENGIDMPAGAIR